MEKAALKAEKLLQNRVEPKFMRKLLDRYSYGEEK